MDHNVPWLVRTDSGADVRSRPGSLFPPLGTTPAPWLQHSELGPVSALMEASNGRLRQGWQRQVKELVEVAGNVVAEGLAFGETKAPIHGNRRIKRFARTGLQA